MVIGILIAILLIAAIAAVIIIGERNETFRPWAIGVIISLVVALIILPFSFHSVNTGEIAVVKQFGKIIDVRESGLTFDWWFMRKYQKYDLKMQSYDVETMAYSSDAQTMDLFITIQYTIMADKVKDIAEQYGNASSLESKIEKIAVAEAKTVMSQNKAMDIIAKRGDLSAEVEKAIKSAVDEHFYINISSVALTNIDFSDAFEQAVEEKMIAEQNKLKADYTNDTKIATAEAEAKAKIVEAEAQAKANKTIQDSLTDKVLEARFYEKWDGKLPNVMGENSVITDISGKAK